MSTNNIDAIRERANAATPFAAHAREDIPALLAEVDRLTRERDRLRTAWESARRRATKARTQGSRYAAPGSSAARMLSEIRERVDQDMRSERILSEEQEDRSRLLGMVDHLREKHATTHAEMMRRGERMVRAEAELAQVADAADTASIAAAEIRGLPLTQGQENRL